MHSVYTYYSCDNINQKEEFLTSISFWNLWDKVRLIYVACCNYFMIQVNYISNIIVFEDFSCKFKGDLKLYFDDLSSNKKYMIVLLY